MRFKLVSLCGVALVLSVLAFSNVGTILAQGNSETYKIGIVDLQRVVNGYKKHTEGIEKLKGETKETQDNLDGLKAAFDKELDAFKSAKDGMSESARADREAELQGKAVKLENQFREAEASLDVKKRQLKGSILKDIVAAVDQIGTKGNFHLILEADPESRTGVLYYATSLEITTQVIERLNANYKK